MIWLCIAVESEMSNSVWWRARWPNGCHGMVPHLFGEASPKYYLGRELTQSSAWSSEWIYQKSESKRNVVCVYRPSTPPCFIHGSAYTHTHTHTELAEEQIDRIGFDNANMSAMNEVHRDWPDHTTQCSTKSLPRWHQTWGQVMTPPHSQPHLMFMTTPRTTIQHLIILNAAGGESKATRVRPRLKTV